MIWLWPFVLASIVALFLAIRDALSTLSNARTRATRGAPGTKASGPGSAARSARLLGRARTAELPKTSQLTTSTPGRSSGASASSAGRATRDVAGEWRTAMRNWIEAQEASRNVGSVGNDNTPGVNMITYGWAECPMCAYKHTNNTRCDDIVELAAKDASTGALTHASFYMCPACGQKHKNAMPDMLTCGEFAARTYNVERLTQQAFRAKDTWSDTAASAERHWQAMDRLENALAYQIKTERTYNVCPACKGEGHVTNQWGQRVGCDVCVGTGIAPSG